MFSSKALAFLISAAALLSSCAAPRPQGDANALPAGFKASVVMAHNAVPGRGALGVTDHFTLDGKVVAFIAFTWTDLSAPWGRQSIEHRWYSGDRLVSQREHEFDFPRSPHNVFTAVSPVALGAGPARYELYWHGIKLAERKFDIVDAAALDALRPAPVRPNPADSPS